jgi:hypothetical protein
VTELPKPCAHNYAISESILIASNFSQEDIADVLAVLQAQGGFCDCEILHNAAPANRLRATYWRKRAAELEAQESETPTHVTNPTLQKT